jgi:hypothetical protein
MKMKIIISAILIVLSNSLFSQTSKELSAISAFMYNTKGKVIEQHYYTVSSGQEDGPQKTFIFYNNNDKVKEQVVINTFGDTTEKIIYQYQGDQITVIDYSYYGSEVIPVSKSVYYGVKESEENNQNALSFMFEGSIGMYLCDSFHIYVWDSDVWASYVKGSYTFNAYDNPDKALINIVMEETMGMDLQMDFIYDNKQNCTQMKASVVVATIPLSLMKVDQTYDANSNLTEIHVYPDVSPILRDNFDDYLTEQKTIYTYNTHNDVSTVTYFTKDESSDNLLETGSAKYVYTSMTINSEIKYVVDTIYHYGELFTGIEDQKQSITEIIIYPNPAKDKMNIQGIESASTLMIYDINGKQIHTQSIKPDDISVSVQSLARGMYILKIINQKGVYFSKFMKE